MLTVKFSCLAALTAPAVQRHYVCGGTFLLTQPLNLLEKVNNTYSCHTLEEVSSLVGN